MPVNDAFSFNVDFKELERMLNQLPKAMSKTVLGNALKKAAKPIQTAAKSNAPVGPTGNLKKSIAVSAKLKGRTVRAKKGAIIFVGSTAPHAHLVEFGTGERYTADGKYVGQMPANPFFRNAWDAEKKHALQVFTKEMQNELLKAVAKLRSKAEKGTLGKGAMRMLQ